MLTRLEVANLAVIEKVHVEFSRGLTCLTGETGAGKSILVDALTLLLGEKADGMTRAGADNLLVTAWFGEQSFSRKISSGRSTPRIDGEVVGIKELAGEISQYLSIHAQHAAISLQGKKSQRQILDSQIDVAFLNSYRESYKTWSSNQKELAALEQETQNRERQLDVLRFQLTEIESAKLQIGEDESLKAESARLSHFESLQEKIAAAVAALSGDADSLGLVGEALKEVRAAARIDEALEESAVELESTLVSLTETSRTLERYIENLEADPLRLEEVEARLALIQKLNRKYGESTEEILAFAKESRAELERLEQSESRLESLRGETEKSFQKLLELGKTLSDQRSEVAEHLSKSISEEIQSLGMPKAKFAFGIIPLGGPAEHGLEDVQLLFSANPGMSLAPLEKVASGGELSRVMLALAIKTGSEAETVVFDEVDAGIGGESAWSVAEKLSELALTRQVLVVTHLPQIASKADTHIRVIKNDDGVEVESIEGETRVRELARMLSGSYSQNALEHAKELLDRKAPRATD